jgi:iron complex outermembrane recepter protein
VVIKGVDELRYGSDAIGGVILVEPKPLISSPGIAGEINLAYFNNNRQYVSSVLFEQQLKKQPAFRYRVQGTYKKGANASTPDYRLNNTGSEEKNFSVTAGWKKEYFNTELFYSHFSTRLGIFTGSHIGNLTDLLNAIASTRPADVFTGDQTYNIQRPSQEVTHDLLKSKTLFYKGNQKFTILLAGQFNRRKEFDIVRSSTNKNPQLDLSIYTFTQDVTWENSKTNNFTSMAGISMTQQDNSYKGRYFIPNYFAYSFGGFFIEKWSKHSWELQAGIRYDNKSIRTTRLKFGSDTINYDFNFSTVGSSFNAIFKPSDKWRFNTNISLASRAPYVNELLSDGIHHGTATYEQGDISLKPERSLNIAAGINFQHPSKKISLDFLLYSNHINDFIYQQPLPAEPVLTIAGAFPLIRYKQTDAVLNGFDLGSNVELYPGLNWITKLSALYARNRRLNDWLILMPANRISNELAYHFKDGKSFSNTYFSAELLQVMTQKNVPDNKNGQQDYKDAPEGYILVNLNSSTTITMGKTSATVSIGVRNLLNISYRDYLNSMRYFTDEMGRNISLRLKIPFKY